MDLIEVYTCWQWFRWIQVITVLCLAVKSLFGTIAVWMPLKKTSHTAHALNGAMLLCCPPVEALTTCILHILIEMSCSPDMKRPKSPNWQDSSPPPPKSQEGKEEEEEEEEDEEERRVTAGHRAKRERRQSSSSATMCQVCNIQLNSSAQAQIHYRGKTHQRRLRRLAKAVSTGRDGLNLCIHFLRFTVDYYCTWD